jgi:riboflavin biosynthesis pyrimidine reductase
MGVTATLTPLEALFESPNLPGSALTPRLEELYGGPLGFDEPRVYANFVSTLDGVVAIPKSSSSNRLIRVGSEGDLFVIGLLRALADVVLTGAGTLAAFPRGRLTPEQSYPPGASDFAELRRTLGKDDRPEVAIVTGSGSIDPKHPVLKTGALVLTSAQGGARLAGRLPAASTVMSLGSEPALDPRDVVGALRARGHRLILSEVGPHGFGALVHAGVVDELFLTVSPIFVGGSRAGDRLGLVEGAAFLPEQRVQTRVLSVKREADHLFLRYALDHPAPAA